jgi:hypothetical protein
MAAITSSFRAVSKVATRRLLHTGRAWGQYMDAGEKHYNVWQQTPLYRSHLEKYGDNKTTVFRALTPEEYAFMQKYERTLTNAMIQGGDVYLEDFTPKSADIHVSSTVGSALVSTAEHVYEAARFLIKGRVLVGFDCLTRDHVPHGMWPMEKTELLLVGSSPISRLTLVATKKQVSYSYFL